MGRDVVFIFLSRSLAFNYPVSSQMLLVLFSGYSLPSGNHWMIVASQKGEGKKETQRNAKSMLKRDVEEDRDAQWKQYDETMFELNLSLPPKVTIRHRAFL